MIQFKKILLYIGLALLFFTIGYFAFANYTYSEGSRTGMLLKFSHKGYVFKTWEGELQMRGVITPQDGSSINMGGNIWMFSVGRGEDAVIQALQTAEAKGARVTLHYIQYSRQFNWRGETVYFVNKVTETE